MKKTIKKIKELKRKIISIKLKKNGIFVKLLGIKFSISKIKKNIQKELPVLLTNSEKIKVFRKYQKDFSAKIFVETGTYLGETPFGLKDDFKTIYTIELSTNLYQKAKERFKKYKHINAIHGDSGEKLKEIMPKLNAKTMFWLDGHYSSGITARGEKDTPIIEELETIFANNKYNHVIMIDDAREFGVGKDYPALIEVFNFVEKKDKDYNVTVISDIIRITKR